MKFGYMASDNFFGTCSHKTILSSLGQLGHFRVLAQKPSDWGQKGSGTRGHGVNVITHRWSNALCNNN